MSLSERLRRKAEGSAYRVRRAPRVSRKMRLHLRRSRGRDAAAPRPIVDSALPNFSPDGDAPAPGARRAVPCRPRAPPAARQMSPRPPQDELVGSRLPGRFAVLAAYLLPHVIGSSFRQTVLAEARSAPNTAHRTRPGGVVEHGHDGGPSELEVELNTVHALYAWASPSPRVRCLLACFNYLSTTCLTFSRLSVLSRCR